MGDTVARGLRAARQPSLGVSERRIPCPLAPLWPAAQRGRGTSGEHQAAGCAPGRQASGGRPAGVRRADYE